MSVSHGWRLVIVGAVALAVSAGCSANEDDAAPSVKPIDNSLPGDRFRDSLPDLEPWELVGLDANGVDHRIFTEKCSQTPRGDGWVHDFGGVRFSNTIIDFTKPLFPERLDLHESFIGDFRVVSACTALDEDDDTYSLFVGVVPIEIADDRLVDRGRSGEFDEVMNRNSECEPWGPVLPLSRMK